MSNTKLKKITKRRVEALPLLKSVVEKIGLRDILESYFPKKYNEEISTADVLMLLIFNLAIGKSPLYELGNWIRSLDLRSLGYEKYKDFLLTDDRFGKALDKLFKVDRATMMTHIVIQAIKAYDVDLSQIHNDSTSVSAFGDYPGKTSTGFELKQGRSKINRPDLKQLIYSLSISVDYAVPVHYKAYPGNRNDDSTHIETWNTLVKIRQDPNFLYVGDCKLCTDNQLTHIVKNGGKAITTIPENWSEVTTFKESLRNGSKAKKEIWRKKYQDNSMVYFSVFDEQHQTNLRGYKIHWIHSSEKKQFDYELRNEHLKKAEKKLLELQPGLNKRKLKSKDEILKLCNEILKHHKVNKFIDVKIDARTEIKIIKQGRGRPRSDTNCQKLEKTIFSFTWERNLKALEAEKNVDGIYPLLSTDHSISSKEVLMAYKYQPKLEKRFTHLKSIHNIQPLLFKKLERVEANMFLFFIALMVQSLIEREIRKKMKEHQIKSIEIYPERRDASHPTTSKVFDIFGDIFTYEIWENEDVINEYSDELQDIHKMILKFLSISEEQYWKGIK